ncbi:hypothetical protein PFISCL1PPCAC_7651, partial [Pristionchus fissidentatus]
TQGWSNAEGTIFAFTNTATTVTAFCSESRSTSKVAAKSEEKQISRTTILQLSTIVGSASFVVGIGLGVGIGLV